MNLPPIRYPAFNPYPKLQAWIREYRRLNQTRLAVARLRDRLAERKAAAQRKATK